MEKTDKKEELELNVEYEVKGDKLIRTKTSSYKVVQVKWRN
jgi:hypothetical protein